MKKMCVEMEEEEVNDPWRRDTIKEVVENESVIVVQDDEDVAKIMHVALKTMVRNSKW